KRKRHPLSISGEDENDSDTNHNVNRPCGEGDGKGLCSLQLSKIYRSKPDSQENQHPKLKNVYVLAKCDEPLCRILRKEGCQVSHHKIVQVSCAVRLQIQDQ